MSIILLSSVANMGLCLYPTPGMTRVQEEEEEMGEEEFTDKSEIKRCEQLPEKQARTLPYHNVFTKMRTIPLL